MRKFKIKSRLWTMIGLLLLGCLLLALPAWAADGTGDGSGGGTDVPLSLATSIPAAGQTDVPVNQVIKLTFNKNVINLTVRDNNKNCFALSTQNGSKVPIQVIMADDQLYPEEKRNISVKPVQPLQPGTAYILTIAAGLQAKNGTSLGQATTVRFTTAGAVAVPDQGANDSGSNNQIPATGNTTAPINSTNGTVSANVPAPAAAGTDATTPEPKSNDTVNNLDSYRSDPESAENNSAAAPVQEPLSKIYIVGAGLILIAALAYLYSRKKVKD